MQAPTTHTVLEIVKARWGTGPHIVFLVFCLLTNIIVTSMLILGGASVVNALTGGGFDNRKSGTCTGRLPAAGGSTSTAHHSGGTHPSHSQIPNPHPQ